MNQRKIKFKLWSKRDGWCGGFCVHQTGLISTCINAEIVEPQHMAVADAHWQDLSEQNDLILLQYTGLKDKNGKEIYEGDVLLVFDEAVVPVTDIGEGPIEECNHIVSVEMRNGIWGFEIPKSDDGETGWYGLHYWNTDISDMGYEVIGNIYESPELINQ